jgi:hypothetical protein
MARLRLRLKVHGGGGGGGYDDDDHDRRHSHHLAAMEFGHLLTRSGLSRPKVSLNVALGMSNSRLQRIYRLVQKSVHTSNRNEYKHACS